jgi:excisionase family DNA binding protein
MSEDFKRLALRVGEVAEMLGVSERHLWALVARGEFPRPLKLGAASRWPYADVVAFLDSKEVAR